MDDIQKYRNSDLDVTQISSDCRIWNLSVVLVLSHINSTKGRLTHTSSPRFQTLEVEGMCTRNKGKLRLDKTEKKST